MERSTVNSMSQSSRWPKMAQSEASVGITEPNARLAHASAELGNLGSPWV